MFDKLKTFFGKFKSQSAPPPTTPPPPTPAQPAKKAATPPAAQPRATAPSPARPAPTAARPATGAPPAAAAAPATGVPDETISLPLKPILAKLPSTLSALVKSSGNGDVSVSLSKVMKQLPQGSVKITFGELRSSAPTGTFLEVASQDQTLVELPLPEILSRLNPTLLTRRTPQKVLDAPAEVGNLFGNRGETLPQPSAPPTIPTAPAKPVSPAAPSLPKTAPAAPSTAPAVPRPAVPAPGAAPKPALPIPAPNLPKPPAAPSLPRPATPTPAPKPAAPIPAPNLPKPSAPAAPAVPKIPAPQMPSTPPPAPKMPEPVSDVRGDSTQYFLNKDAVAAGETITVPLASLTESWPDAVKDEVKKSGMENSSVAFPMNQLEVALKSGKIIFPWKQIAAWLRPTPPTTTLLGETSVELPLKVIAPLFISQHKPTKTQKKVTIGENIPDIFSGGTVPKPAAAVPTTIAPLAPTVPSPAAVPSIPKPAQPAVKPSSIPLPTLSVVAAKEPTTIGEIFGQPEKKEWPPNEIVQRTSALKGLSGALIATSDGLLVAGQMPAPYRAETIGAFLPQIFGRMNQYGKELQVGEMNSLQMDFNKVPWYIVKLGHIYFGAVGKAGEAFPTSLLKVIASELEKPTR